MNINPTTIAQALWATRQPDDSYQPCSWVHVYTWRGERCVIVLTELETLERIERRVDGHVQINNCTRYLVCGSTVDYEAVKEAMRLIVSHGTQSNPENRQNPATIQQASMSDKHG